MKIVIIIGGNTLPMDVYPAKQIRYSAILGKNFLCQYVDKVHFNKICMSLLPSVSGELLHFFFYEKRRRELEQEYREAKNAEAQDYRRYRRADGDDPPCHED